MLAALALSVGTLVAEDAESALDRARAALSQGEETALRHAVEALRDKPFGADENIQVALTLFWMGHFEDSARYMRRALSLDVSRIEGMGPLSGLVPADDIAPRLNQLAREAEHGSETCFLTGVLLLLNGDRTRALPFLIRAEELAGADGQISSLAASDGAVRTLRRAETAMRNGEYRDAARSFAFAAADDPSRAEYYAGLALALACLGDLEPARQLLDAGLPRRGAGALPAWLKGIEAAGETPGTVAAHIRDSDNPRITDLRLAALLLFMAGDYAGARAACVEIFLQDRLDDLGHELMRFMDENDLGATPDNTNPARHDTPPAAPAPRTLEEARRLLRRGDYDEALDAVDPHVDEDADAGVFYLLFVILAGRRNFDDAAVALQAWFDRADGDERTRLNTLREMFARAELFDAWRDGILRNRNDNPDAAAPRLLNAYVEITRGRYRLARDEVAIARAAAPGNPMARTLDSLLADPRFRHDVTPGGIHDDPDALALKYRASQSFVAGRYEEARDAMLRAIESDPDVPGGREDLLRVYFALGDFANAALQLKALLDRFEAASAAPEAFRLNIRGGYEDEDVFHTHLHALRLECEHRPLASEPYLLLGLIELDRRRFRQAAEALQHWHNNTPGRRHSGALRLREHALKQVD